MRRFLLLCLLWLIGSSAASAQSGIFIRSGTSSITNPIIGQTYCFDYSTTVPVLRSYNIFGWTILSNPFSNYSASAAPTVSNDNTEGYQVGSIWIDTTHDISYVCASANTGAAVWLQQETSSSGTVTQINTGTGLSGGPITTTGTISLANTAVTAGSYTNANITVNAQGQITAAANGSGGDVASVSNSDGTLTISPTTGSVVASLAALTSGDILVGNTSNVATGVPMSGDATLSNAGTITLKTVNSNVGTYQGLTVNAKGLVTAATNENYLTANQTITLSGDASGSGTTAITTTLATVNNDTSSVGSSTSIPTITANAKGLVTSVTGNPVVAPAGTLTGTTLASNVITSSLTSVGTIVTGVWNGSIIGTAYQPSTTVNSTGNLSPLFTSSISGQALSFSQSNASAGTIFGNWNSTTGPPSFNAGGTTGQLPTVQSNGSIAWAPPAYTGTVTSVATGTGLAGGPITTSGTISLAGIADNTVLGSVTTGTNAPVALTATQLTTIPNVGTDLLQGMVPALTDGKIIVGKTGSPIQTVSASGDIASITNAGVFTLANTAVSAASYGSSTSIPSFTVDAKGRLTAASGNVVVAPAGTLTGTTLASNVVSSSLTSLGTITSGTWEGAVIGSAYIPTPTTSTIGGVEAITAVSHEWISSINTSGVPQLSQPAFSDISGSASASQMPAFSGDISTSAGSTVTTLATVNSDVGTYTNATITVNAKGLVTAASSGSSGSGTVDSGTGGQITYYASTGTTVSGNADATISSGQLTLGQSGTAGSIVLNGSTSGTVTLGVSAAAGAGTVFNLPSSNGTNGYVLQTDGSGNTSWHASSGGGGTVTSVATGTGLTGGPITSTGTISVANGTANTLAGYNSSGVFSDVSIGSGLTLSGGNLSATGGGGGVSSVALSDGSSAPIYTITGSPITTSGTLTFTLANENANTIFAGPSSGSGAQPTFRSIVASDLPSTTVNSSGNLSPLFTSNISAQALSFSLSNAGAGTLFGNFGTSSAAPSFNVAGNQYQSLSTIASGGLGWNYGLNGIAALTGTTTLTNSSASYQTVAPGASNATVTLPLTTTCQGKVFVIEQIGGSGTVTLASNASDTIESGATSITLVSGFPIGLMSDGTSTWRSVIPEIVGGTTGNSILSPSYGGTGTGTIFTTGSVVFAGPSGIYTQDNSNLFWDNTNNRLGIQNSSPSYPLDVSGDARVQHIICDTSTPSYTAGSGAGTSPTISVSGTDNIGTISVTTGTSPTAQATIVTITFAVAYANAPIVITSPGNGAAGALSAAKWVTVGTTSASTFTLLASGALAASTAYVWNYVVMGQ